MYLSKIMLNPRNRNVARDLADCYQMHRSIMSMFPTMAEPTTSARNDMGVLFRVEQELRGNSIIFILQSKVEPNVDMLPSGYVNESSGSNSIAPVSIKNIDSFVNHINAGTTYRFRLRANPTWKTGTTSKEERLSGKQKSNGKRAALSREQDRIDWIVRKGLENGFELLSVAFTSPGRRGEDVKTIYNVRTTGLGEVLGRKPRDRKSVPGSSDETSSNNGNEHQQSKKPGKQLSFYSVVFEGYLRVVDKEKFRMGFENGIGPAKSFGFGLLSIAPVG
ncbi:MAG TPA: type I-E CRISPR-associated protein Cas6/Cse3/CasE [Candidatus Lokiarchaeia archaeon]|nr:type I-E CRISPR-associated protein Cas6/Cse3/CasE [Candidatus Lokiarchaeia archaeon]